MRLGILAHLSISLLICLSPCFAYDRVFYEDCESSFSEYFLEANYGTTFEAYWDELKAELTRSGTAHFGSYSMTYDPWVTDDPHAVVGLGPVTYGNTSDFDLHSINSRYWYFRWYQRWESNQTYSGENKVIYINYQTAGDFTLTIKKNSGTSWHITLKDRATYEIIDNPYPSYSGGDLDDDEWHKMEVYIDVGTTGGGNGTYWINIDDIELYSNTDVTFNATINSNPIEYLTGWPSNVSSQTGSQQTWLDDLEIYTLTGPGDIPPVLSLSQTSINTTGTPITINNSGSSVQVN